MLRTALTPRWLGLLALVLGVSVVFTLLGLWQLGVARDEGRQEQVAQVQAQPEADITAVLQPHAVMAADAVGRAVRATGTYDTEHQLLVAGRRQGGAQGLWILTPLVLDSSARLPVLRGFVTDAAAVPPPPAGRVSVRGTLSPPESAPNERTDLPAGQIASVDLADLVNTWPGELYNAMVFVSSDGATVNVPARIPPPDLTDAPVAWRNLAYAMQWWLFAAFAVYMWWRAVRDESRQRLAAEPADTTPSTSNPATVPDRGEPHP